MKAKSDKLVNYSNCFSHIADHRSQRKCNNIEFMQCPQFAHTARKIHIRQLSARYANMSSSKLDTGNHRLDGYQTTSLKSEIATTGVKQNYFVNESESYSLAAYNEHHIQAINK